MFYITDPVPRRAWVRAAVLGGALLSRFVVCGTGVCQESGAKVVETFVTAGNLETGVGAENRAVLGNAQRLMQQQKRDEAEKLVDTVLADFAKRMTDPAAAYLSFANREEVTHYLKEHPGTGKVIWLDWAFGDALHKKAFLAAARKDWKAALELLDREVRYRPYAADPYTERGWVLNQQGKRHEALQSYRKALELAEKYASSRHAQAIALRGIGWTLFELKDLAGARQAYERSLKIDPNNRVALEELESIRKMESR
jgi:tetratricopeptide (TPR) repeat protein